MGTKQQPGAAAAGGARAWRLALAGLAVGVFAALALSGPGRIDIVDGQTRYEVARSLVDHGDSVIRDQHVWFAVLPGRDGLPHTNYRLPQPALGTVAIRLADLTGPADEARRQFFFTLIGPAACAVLALAYAAWFRGLGHTPRAGLGWAAAGIFCTPCWYYGTSTFDDQLGAATVVPAVVTAFLLRERRPRLGAALAGGLLGLAFNCKQPLGLFVLPVLAACYRPGVALRRQLAPAGLVLAGLALGVAVQVGYEAYKFPPGTTDPARSAEALYGAVWAPDPLAGLAAFAASPSAGALWYCPTLLLSAGGWWAWRRRGPLLCGATLLAAAGFTLFVSWLTFFKGDPCWGPRYLTPVFALFWLFTPAALPAVSRPLVGGLLVLGVLVQLLALSVDPQRLYLQLALPFNYYQEDRWLGFEPAASHLVQRPREIAEILADDERCPEYSPGPTGVCSCYLGGKLASWRGRVDGGRKSGPCSPPRSCTMASRQTPAAAVQTREERIEALMNELRPKIEATIRRLVERAVDVPEAEEFGAIDLEFRDAGQELANDVRQAGLTSRKKRGTSARA